MDQSQSMRLQMLEVGFNLSWYSKRVNVEYRYVKCMKIMVCIYRLVQTSWEWMMLPGKFPDVAFLIYFPGEHDYNWGNI